MIFAESIGAILTGWVRETFVEPEFTFTVIGLEWLQPLPGPGMYFYFGLMGLCGLGVMLGYQYRFSIGLFTILWSMTYVMQKSHYNNHYYLLILLCLFMWFVPAHGYASFDAKNKNSVVSLTCSRWCISIFKILLWIVFTYAAIAKLYPGWLQGDFIELIFRSKASYPIIGELLQKEWLQKIVVYGGIFFDLLIVYFLLWKRTRIAAFVVGLFFHLFNSAVFQIGIFPYLMIGAAVLFFEPETIRKLFLKKKPIPQPVPFTRDQLPVRKQVVFYGMMLFFIVQILLPVRHHRFRGDVAWTEEGHRLSWRMMLRSKSGNINFEIVDVTNDSTWNVKPGPEITRAQKAALASKPDMIWQYSQYLKKKYQKKGLTDLKIYAKTNVRLNKSKYHPIIDRNQDLASTKWQRFKHSDWILSPIEE